MASIERAGACLYFEDINIVPPWVRDPQTIIFHHGIGTTSGIWGDWLPVLGAIYRMVRLDMRGFGQSSSGANCAEWSFQLLADDVLAVADNLGISKFHFVGESVGGTLGLYLGIYRAHRLHSLVVSNGAHRGTAVQNVRPWKEMIDRDGQEAWSSQLMDQRFYAGALSEEKYHWFHHQQSTCSINVALGLAQLLLSTDLAEEVSRIPVPTLLLSPDNSPFIPVAIMADLYSRLKSAELQVCARTRHGLPYSHGAECAGVVKRFLKERATEIMQRESECCP